MTDMETEQLHQINRMYREMGHLHHELMELRWSLYSWYVLGLITGTIAMWLWMNEG